MKPKEKYALVLSLAFVLIGLLFIFKGTLFSMYQEGCGATATEIKCNGLICDAQLQPTNGGDYSCYYNALVFNTCGQMPDLDLYEVDSSRSWINFNCYVDPTGCQETPSKITNAAGCGIGFENRLMQAVNTATYHIEFKVKTPVCTPNWVYGTWSSCFSNGTQIRTDTDGCGHTQIDSQTCDYVYGGGSGGGPIYQCQTYSIPSCNILEKLSAGGTDSYGCDLPFTCELNPDVAGPILFIIILIVSISAFLFIRRN